MVGNGKINEIFESNFLLFAENDVETVVQLINQNAKAKHHVEIGIDAEEYYKIKDSEKDSE